MEEQKPAAWGVWAEVDGEWFLQYPVRFSKEDATTDLHHYAVGMKLDVRPLYASPFPPSQGKDSDAQDAARYRWLRECDPDAGPCVMTHECSDWGSRYWLPRLGEALDAAIDAAMKEQP